ncbi:MAG: hypothetical protein AAF988_03675 [Pseudomonadota bacterium]
MSSEMPGSVKDKEEMFANLFGKLITAFSSSINNDGFLDLTELTEQDGLTPDIEEKIIRPLIAGGITLIDKDEAGRRQQASACALT